MNSYYIHKLIISGFEKKDSIIEFSSGCTIIYGPSNTGKTYIIRCINYLFGGDENPIDPSLGYDVIKMVIKTSSGVVQISRNLNQTDVEISSTDNKIDSGIYKLAGKYENTLNSVLLKLIGIEDQHFIAKNENYAKQSLTWRTFIHMFLLTELRIIDEKSILLPVTQIRNTAVISALLFLIDGFDCDRIKPIEDPKIREMKKKAVISYINKEIFRISDRRGALSDKLALNTAIDLDEEIEKIVNEISLKETEITSAINRNQSLLNELVDNNEKLSECNCLYTKYLELSTQYTTDIDRLSFIIDGFANMSIEHKTKCPFCDSNIIVPDNPDYIEASKVEYKKLKLQLNDLEKAISSVELEKQQLEEVSNKLSAEKLKLDDIINNELKPRVLNLREKLSKYRDEIRMKNEIDVLKTITDEKAADIAGIDSEDESFQKYKPKEFIDRSILDKIDDLLFNILDICAYENLTSVRFDRESMDVIINGKNKKDFGKGYRAFLNTILSMTFCKYLSASGKYKPNLLILDSPILSLEEPTEKVSDSMKNSLFSYLTKNTEHIQVIIIENKLPDIDYKNSKVIKFTKDKNEGRYGLLNDVY